MGSDVAFANLPSFLNWGLFYSTSPFTMLFDVYCTCEYMDVGHLFWTSFNITLTKIIHQKLVTGRKGVLKLYICDRTKLDASTRETLNKMQFWKH